MGTSATNSSLLKLEYYYGAEQNNGNVLRQIITVPTIGADTGFIATQHYQYDQLNRLTGSQEVSGVSSSWQSSGSLWQQKFSYDRFGNRAVDTGNTTSTMIGPNPQISTSNNRITNRSGEYYDYDYAGNMTKGQSGDTFDYDAENKLVQYQGGSTESGGSNYSYDGDGKRVKKAKPSETTTFVYNIAGQLVAEYTTSTPENNGTSYVTSDTLGTPRVITKADGSVRARHDYLPFGEEVYASAGNRTTGQGYDNSSYPVDKTRQKFTGKERDNETGLDYFIARYYSSPTGRFISPDPLYYTASRPGDPQQFNLYVYVRNNPLKLVDPDGKDEQIVAKTPEDLKATEAELRRLAPGTRVDAKGKIHKPGFFRRLANRLTGHGKGTALISRIVDSKNTTVISVRQGTGAAHTIYPEEGTKGRDECGCTSLIEFDPTFKDSNNLSEERTRDAGGSTTDTSPIHASPFELAISLGHELIHADHFNRNGAFDSTPDIHAFKEGGASYQERVERGEFRAVGFSGFTKSSDITENQLRRELNIAPRAAYLSRSDWEKSSK